MRNWVVVLGALLLAASSGAATAGSSSGPIVGATWAGGGELVLLDPLTLAPVQRSSVRLRAGWSVTRSANGSRLAVANGRTLRVVDAKTLRELATSPMESIRLGVAAWPARDRLIVGQWAPAKAALLDPITGATLASHRLSGTTLGMTTTRDGVVMLLGRTTGLGPLKLALVDRDGMRLVSLPVVRGGFKPPAEMGGVFVRQHPGLAVDPAGRRAAIVGLDVVVEVDLDTLATRSHELELRTPSSVRKVIEGWSRRAVWATSGLLAVTGVDYEPGPGGRQMVVTPAGLTLVDTRRWGTSIVDPGATEVVLHRRTLLATGTSCDGAAQPTCTGIGLRGYTPEGRMRFHLFGDSSLAGTHVHGRYAYLGGCNSRCYRIVDTITGSIVRDLRTKKQTILVD
jgi:hypothetical protein